MPSHGGLEPSQTLPPPVHRPVTVAFVTLVVLALLYPFSIGPLILLMGGNGSDALTVFLVEQYHPWVYWLYDVWPSSGPWVDYYIDLWLSLR